MNFLEERIVKDGIITEGNVLKVDSFLNHQKAHQQDTHYRGLRQWHSLCGGPALQGAGGVCKEDPEHQPGGGNVCGGGGVLYPSLQEPGHRVPEIPGRGGPCAHHR